MPFAVALGILTDKAWLPLLIIFIFYRLLQWYSGRSLTVRTPIDWSVFLLFLTLPVTLWVTVQPQVTYLQIYRLLGGIAISYSLANSVTSAVSLRLLPVGVVGAGIMLACVAPFTVEWITDKFSFIPATLYALVPRNITEQIHPNIIAGTLAILVPMAVAPLLFAWQQATKWERLVYLTGTLAMSGILVLTQSRGALMGSAIALFSLILLRWRWRWQVTLAVLALLSGVIYLGGPNIFIDQTSLSSVRGWEGRKEIWSRAFYIIQDFPFTGIGMGNFNLIADTFYPFLLAAPDQTPHAHNLFLQIAVDLGLPGLSAWLALVLIVLTISGQLLQMGQTTNNSWLAGLSAGLLASQLAMLVHGITDAVLWGSKPAVILWVVWGIGLATFRLYQTPILAVYPSAHTP